MPTPRRCIVDDDAVGTYHCISRCVRRVVRAGMVDRPEDTPNGSIAERVRILLGVRRRTRIRLEPAPFEDEAGYLSHVDA